MCVASRSHAFATVSFTPQTMQTYQCIFEATLDGLPRYQLPSSLACPPRGMSSLPGQAGQPRSSCSLQQPGQEPEPRV